MFLTNKVQVCESVQGLTNLFVLLAIKTPLGLKLPVSFIESFQRSRSLQP